MAASGLLVSVFRNSITQEVRIPVYILIVASMVTLVDLCMNAWMHELYKAKGGHVVVPTRTVRSAVGWVATKSGNLLMN